MDKKQGTTNLATNKPLKKGELDTSKAYSLRLKTSLYDGIDNIAKKRGHSVNTMMVLALNEWLQQQQKEA